MATPLRFVVGLGLLAAMTGPASAQTADLGKAEYQASCAVCHGSTGHGEGPLRAHLVKRPADLTTLARRNGGRFPHESVLRTIDGRAAIGAHGTREMPVWGQIFFEQERVRATEGRVRVAPEWSVQQRIVALVEYLEQLQEK